MSMRACLSLVVFLGLAAGCRDPQLENESAGSSEQGIRWDAEGYESGEVSCYGVAGEAGLGNYTALGIRFRPQETDKAACASELLGQYIELSCPRETFKVQCVDTGGFRNPRYNRILDLYAGTFKRCFGTPCPSLGRAKYRREDSRDRYCGRDFVHIGPTSEGGLSVSVDQRCPVTEAEITFLMVEPARATAQVQASSIVQSKVQISKMSAPTRLALQRSNDRLQAELTPELLSSVDSGFTNVRIGLTSGSKIHFVTGPVIPSPPLPKRPQATETRPSVEASESPKASAASEGLPPASTPSALDQALSNVPPFRYEPPLAID